MKLETFEMWSKLKSTVKRVPHPTPLLENSILQAQTAGRGDRAPEQGARGQAWSSLLLELSVWAWQLFGGFCVLETFNSVLNLSLIGSYYVK